MAIPIVVKIAWHERTSTNVGINMLSFIRWGQVWLVRSDRYRPIVNVHSPGCGTHNNLVGQGDVVHPITSRAFAAVDVRRAWVVVR